MMKPIMSGASFGAAVFLTAALLLTPSACLVSERCFKNEDCDDGERCSPSGACVRATADHGAPDLSGDGAVPIRCPLPGMTKVGEAFCIDIYEASRPDATELSAGVDESRAVSRQGVLPWRVSDNATAQAACVAAGKRLCTASEWLLACQGPDTTTYSYGDTYEPETCNGIDTFGRDAFHLTPTGSFPGCVNEWGVLDINGNLWEHVAGGNDRLVRGGAFNCGDSRLLHRCDYVPGNWAPSARGFRCCAGGVPITVDAGTSDGPSAEGGALEQGCLPDPELGLSDARSPDASPCDAALDNAAVDDAARPDAHHDAHATDASVIDAAADAPGRDARADGPVSDAAADSTSGADSAPDGSAADLSVDPLCGLPGMVSGEGLFCIDVYEAARPDATATFFGANESYAVSRSGVLPWMVADNATAQAACAAAGKRLCSPAEWQAACQGPDRTTYSYGDTYEPTTCNGIQTFAPPTPFHLLPTGSLPGCTNAYGVLDLNGNLWEHVAGGDNTTIRGGAYNCGDSMTYHRCDYIPTTWTPSARGFRCCAPVATGTDGGPPS